MTYLSFEHLRELQDGNNFFRMLGDRTPEELAEDLDKDPQYIRRCLSLAKKFKDIKD